MFGTLLGLLTGLGGPIIALSNRIVDLQKAKQQAQTDREKMAYDQQIEEAHDRRAVLVAEAGNRVAGGTNAIFRAFLALPAGIVLWKLFVWDKVVGSFAGCSGPGSNVFQYCSQFRTDALDTNQWWVITAVIAFYFLYNMASKALSK